MNLRKSLAELDIARVHAIPLTDKHVGLRLPRLELSSKSPVLTDIETEQLAARKIAREFSLPVSITKVIAHHAGLGEVRQ